MWATIATQRSRRVVLFLQEDDAASFHHAPCKMPEREQAPLLVGIEPSRTFIVNDPPLLMTLIQRTAQHAAQYAYTTFDNIYY